MFKLINSIIFWEIYTNSKIDVCNMFETVRTGARKDQESSNRVKKKNSCNIPQLSSSAIGNR